MFNLCKLKLKIIFSFVVLFFSSFIFADLGIDELFKSEEIRVIRPRYFNKSQRLELGSQAISIINQTFSYTFMGSATVVYHLNERWAGELFGSYGFDIDKEDKVLLGSAPFNINTQISTPKYFAGSSILWTPMYGKYQLASDSLIYFDSFVSIGGGASGIEHNFLHCKTVEKESEIFTYPFFSVGIGQRYFLSQNSSLRWDIKSFQPLVNSSDTECSENSETNYQIIQNITVNLGYAYFL